MVKVNPVPKQLILLEAGIEPHRWTDFVREVDSSSGSLVLAEDSADLSRLKILNVKADSIDGYIPLNSTLGGILFSRAFDLVSTWISQAPLSECAQALEYDGLSLWEMGSFEAERIVWAILKRVEALRDVWRSGEWEQIYSLENRHILWNALCVAIADVGFSGDVQRISMKGYSSLGRRLYDLLIPGWGSQVVKDIFYSLQSCPRPKLASSYRKADSRPYLFLVNSYGTYLFTSLPVIQEMKGSHEVLVLNTGGIIRTDQLQEQGVDLSYCSQYVPSSAWSRIVRRTRELRRVWDKLENDARFPALFEYRGRLLWPALRNPLRKHFLHLLPRLMVWVEAMKHIFESIRPWAVVTVPDRHASARIAIALARRYGVPSLTVQAALMGDNPSYGPMYADKVAAIDEYSRRIFLERGGVAPERVVITGQPRWDGIPQIISRAKKESVQLAVREQLGLNAKDKLVVFATQTLSPSYTQRMTQAVMHAMAQYADMRLVIKLHPADSLENYNALLVDLDWVGREPMVVADIDLHALLATSELLVTGFSNVALEAALLDKPVLIVNLTGEPDPLPFVQNGIAVGAYSETEVKQQFTKILGDPLTREQLRARRHQYKHHNPQLSDGRATERVANLLRQMQNEHNHLDKAF